MTDGWPERFNLLWDLHGNTKVVGRVYLAFRRGKGAGWLPIQRTWLNETDHPWRYGRGIGVRLPRRMISLGIWSRVGQQEYALQQRERRIKPVSEMRTASSQTGEGVWDVLADT